MHWLFSLWTFQVAQSQNRVYLNASALMLNIGDKEFDEAADAVSKRKK